ncbi:MAG: hypothetical protein V7606_458, partial [Burkholderiales bacterium]
MLVVTIPYTCRAERRWISAVVLGEFLGLAYELQFDTETTVRISASGKTLEMPDIFFARAGDIWLVDESLPQEPLQQWTIADSRLDVDLGEPRVPVLFGACGYEVHGEGARLGLDIFGSCFFMLSRYEEAVSKQRDHHDRVPAHASLACRQSFLDRPI